MVELQRPVTPVKPKHGWAGRCSLHSFHGPSIVNSYQILIVFLLSPHRLAWLASVLHLPSCLSMASRDSDKIEGRPPRCTVTPNPLHLELDVKNLRGSLPNTLLAVVIIAFFLGGIFCVSFLTVAFGNFEKYWWFTRQLAFFLCAWSLFHWAEFAVTAGWNLERCNVDCEPIFRTTSFPDPISYSLFTEQWPLVLYCSCDRPQWIPDNPISPARNKEPCVCFSIRWVFSLRA